MINQVQKYIILCLMVRGGLHGQSTAELTDYIIREFKACDNAQLEIKEANFTDNDSVFKLAISTDGQMMEQSWEISLADADIYAKRVLVKTETNEYTYTYNLVATTRGRSRGIRRNMSRITGTEVLLRHVWNGSQMKGLEAAFARLTALTTGRKPPVPVPTDQP